MSFKFIAFIAMEMGFIVLIGLLYLSIMMIVLAIHEVAKSAAERVKNARNKGKDTRRDTKHE